MEYLRYSDDLDRAGADEMETINGIISAMTTEMDNLEQKYGHAMRASHSKATGLLTGELEVLADLPQPYAQGLFAEAARYPALIRVAQGPGEPLPDSISTHRGLSIKLLGVTGPKIPEDEEENTQDFLLATGKTFTRPDAAAFLKDIRGLASAPKLPDAVKGAASNVARAANKALHALGTESGKLDFFGHKPVHPLAEQYFSQVPIRFGDHVAKVGLFPVSPDLVALADQEIDAGSDDNAFRRAVVDYCRTKPADFELRVQLALDPETTPIDDATVEWPEDETPYRTVARLHVPAQDAYSESRRAFFDERLSFRPAHSLQAHRPIGSIMRARLEVYRALVGLRQTRSGVLVQEPTSLAEVPA